LATIGYLGKMKSGKKPNRPVIILRDLAILCLIGNGITFFMEPDMPWSLKIVVTNCLFSVVIGFPAWRGSGYFISILDKRIPWLDFPIKRLLIQTLGLIFFAVAVLMVAIISWVWISEEITFQNIREYAITSLTLIVILMLISVIVTNAILFFINWRNAVLKQEELKRAHLTLQYQSLKTQIRPHFLFNSLSSLVTLIEKDTRKATQFVHKLSDVYRYVLDQSENELVPMAEEVKFLKDYLFLQQIRYGNSLRIEFDLSVDNSWMLVPLSLQMMVENAIKHNEVSSEHPLVIQISQTDSHVVIKNRIRSKPVMEESHGTGIENLRKRIAYFTDALFSIQKEGDYFTVRLPAISSKSPRP
jgi:sensor histidine kinase YesM